MIPISSNSAIETIPAGVDAPRTLTQPEHAFGQTVVRANYALQFVQSARQAVRVASVESNLINGGDGSGKNDAGPSFLTDNERDAYNAACDCLTVFFKAAV